MRPCNACVPLLYRLQDATLFSSIEMSFALVLSLSINIAIVCVAGAVCSNPNITSATSAECSDITLNNAYFLLQVGWSVAIVGIRRCACCCIDCASVATFVYLLQLLVLEGIPH